MLYFRAAATRYGWSHDEIMSLTPRQLIEYLKDDEGKDSGPTYNSMREALASIGR
jgi:hypothetical protein